jgi:hypothetical protein
MTSSLSKQIEDLLKLDKMSKGNYFQQFFRGVVILLVVLLGLGFYTKLPPYFMVAAFVGLIIFASHRSIPHIKNAARAITEGQKAVGSVKVEKIYDSEACTTIVEDPTLGTWHFTFIPTGWKPTEGQFSATIYHLPNVAWPVLVEVKDGIMVPREKPKRSPR